LVNNAGHIPHEGPFIEQNLKAWFTGFEINILGTAIVTQRLLQVKGPERTAITLNVSSMAAHRRFALAAWAGYNGSKMGQARIFENI
jgi:NAD(P)-dependent dehydrogenase (short-subunit alcohol dehydrogenase family)